MDLAVIARRFAEGLYGWNVTKKPISGLGIVASMVLFFLCVVVGMWFGIQVLADNDSAIGGCLGFVGGIFAWYEIHKKIWGEE